MPCQPGVTVDPQIFRLPFVALGPDERDLVEPCPTIHDPPSTHSTADRQNSSVSPSASLAGICLHLTFGYSRHSPERIGDGVIHDLEPRRRSVVSIRYPANAAHRVQDPIHTSEGNEIPVPR